MKVYNPENETWEFVKTGGTYIPTRKYHSGGIVGKHLMIYGGLNDKNNFLGDTAVLNMENWKWKIIETKGAVPPPTAFHTISIVLTNEQRKT